MQTEPKVKILLVDDRPANLVALESVLSDLGQDLVKAYSGTEALKYLLKEEFAVILLDVTMPGIDGFETCRRLKAAPATADVPVIFCSALTDLDEVVAGLEAGASDYVTKPYKPAELLARVRAHVRIKRLRDERARLHRQLEAELARAGQIQADLLSLEPPSLPGFELAARCVSARDVGGDFYSWSQPAPGTLKLTLGDVMGKGMPAALLMATARAAVRAASRDDGPAAALNATSRALQADLERSGSFVTLFHASLDAPARRLYYADAGHGHAFVRRRDGTPEGLESGGLPLGILPDDVYHEGSVALEPGDALVVYSDGVVESRSEATLGPATLAGELDGTTSASHMVDRLVRLATGSGSPPDDVTVLVLRCTDER